MRHIRNEAFSWLGVFLAALFVVGLALASSEGPWIWNLVGVLMIGLFAVIGQKTFKHLKNGGI